MRIVILNGDPDLVSPFHTYLAALAEKLETGGHAVERLDLATLDLKGCSGCFGCWVRTPGICAKRDDSAVVCQAVINADLALLASPLKMGFTTALLKRAADQMIPLIHPYFAVEGGELHHRARYAHCPAFGLLLGAGEDSDAEDIEIASAMWRRMARNFKSRLAMTAVTNRSAGEVADELTLVA
jgi:multimeric flavodoxin WrbA